MADKPLKLTSVQRRFLKWMTGEGKARRRWLTHFELEALRDMGMVEGEGNKIRITEAGRQALEES